MVMPSEEKAENRAFLKLREPRWEKITGVGVAGRQILSGGSRQSEADHGQIRKPRSQEMDSFLDSWFPY
jgi:hypothetical protein